MKIEKNQFYNTTQDVSGQYDHPTLQEIGTYRIQSIQDWGSAMLIQIASLKNPADNGTFKIYVNKERFKASFAEGDIVTRFRQIPVEGIQFTEYQGQTVDNTREFFIHTTSLQKSELFYPWDPQD